MFKAVAAVRDLVLQRSKGARPTLEVITAAFKDITALDVIVFVGYDTSEDNPVWGEFTRWSLSPGPYRSFETVVEVRYAKHLIAREERLVFVVCKELCHALEASDGLHDVSKAGIGALVDSFALRSAAAIGKDLNPLMRIELLAEVAALEVLYPVADRRAYIAKHGVPTPEVAKKLAIERSIPEEYCVLCFEEDLNSLIEVLLNNGK